MRRAEKASGVIRPRTLGLNRPAPVPEPVPPPPPQSAPPPFFQNRRVRMALLVGLVVLCLMMITRNNQDNNNSKNSIGGGVALSDEATEREDHSTSSSGLRSEAHADDDEEEDGEEADERPKKNKKKAHGEDDDDEDGEDSGNGEEDGSEDSAEEETGDKGGDNAERDKGEQPNLRPNDLLSARSKQIGDGKQDRSKTVESYFVNFGGRVVDIDREGSYKYVLVRMEDLFGHQALLVRGCPHKEGTHCKHNDAFSRAKAELELRGFKATVLGGGRITRHPSRHQKGQKEGYISVFGYSKTFGACEDCNKLACALIKASLPDHGVKWANEGYLESDERKVRDDAWTRC